MNQSLPPTPMWRGHAWRLAAVAALVLIAYSNSFQAGLIFDNAQAILQDARVHDVTARNIHLIVTEEYWYQTSTTGLFRPLATLSYLFNYAVLGNGPNPAGYHLVNLLLHIANLSLVYVLAFWIAGDAAFAMALAAIWGLHPRLTDSVTNVVGRADLLAAFGVLSGLLAFLAVGRTTGRRMLVWVAVFVAAAGIAIFSKEEGIVLPAVILLYAIAWWKPSGFRKSIPVACALAALPFLAYFVLRGQILAREPVGRVPFVDNPLAYADFWTAKLTAIQVIGKYIEMFVWPARLSADYSYSATALFGGRVGDLLEIAICLAVAALAVVSWRRFRPMSFCLLFFFVTLAPVSNVFLPIGSIMAERFLYLPAIGLAGGLAAAIRCLPKQSRDAVLAVICLALGARTWARNPDWRDERSLWSTAAAACPDSCKAHALLAETLIRGGPGDVDRATSEAERSLAIVDSLPDDRNSPRVYATAGMCFRVKGDSLGGTAAGEWYRKALAALERGARIDGVDREQTRQLNSVHGKRVSASGWMPIYLELGRVYQRLGDSRKALEPLTYGRAHSLDQQFTIETARALAAAGQWEQGAIVLIQGLLAGSQPTLLTELANLYRKAAPVNCAVRGTGDAVQINMDCPLVHGHVCEASREVAGQFRRGGHPEKAEAVARSAVQDLGCPAQDFR